MILKILMNYFIILICVAGFRGGVLTALILPGVQVCLCCFHYSHSKRWQTVLMLEVHLLIATVLGLYLEGCLYLKYVSDDVESVLVFREILKIGAVLVSGLGVITTSLKYLLTKNNNQK